MIFLLKKLVTKTGAGKEAYFTKTGAGKEAYCTKTGAGKGYFWATGQSKAVWQACQPVRAGSAVRAVRVL